MNFAQISGFLAIVKLDSFSLAAEDLYISQSSLSKQIKSLETELGVQLFHRNKNKLYLNSAGKEFNQFAQKAYNDYQGMLANLSELSVHQVLEIKVGTIPILDHYSIASRFVEFQSSHPSLHVDITVREQKQLISQLENKKIDYTVIRIDYLDFQKFDVIPMVKDKLVLVCSIDHPYSQRERINLKELADQPIVSLDQQSVIYDIVINNSKKHHFVPDIRYGVKHHSHLLKMVSLGLGISLLPEKLVDNCEANRITFIPLEEDIVSTIGLVRIRQQKTSLNTRKLWNFFKEHSV
ncbi:LysR family transcriptional regulator [Paenibacillus thiaminolyticus]|uniref:LysR family transcriptional regulator n=1 Tax=Paenibacillus thiaminolyticus TaxID=49283 RepID=UPI0035A68A34